MNNNKEPKKEEHIWNTTLIPSVKTNKKGILDYILGKVYCLNEGCNAFREYDYPVDTVGIRLSQFTYETGGECVSPTKVEPTENFYSKSYANYLHEQEQKVEPTTEGLEESHETEDNWCCACPYDTAKMEKKITQSNSQLLKEIEGIENQSEKPNENHTPEYYNHLQGYNKALEDIKKLLQAKRKDI